jgi:transcriptional regulator with XRE-family HTH domain
MAKNWTGIRKTLAPEREVRIQARVRAEIARLSLHQLRNARKLTQTSLAETLGMPQGGVSRLERRTDMYISTLRNYIRAMGGALNITAVFPDAAVEISQFHDVGRAAGARSAKRRAK